jgi:hypothetical protein
MAIYRYIVTVETLEEGSYIRDLVEDELDSTLGYDMLGGQIEHFIVEHVSPTFGQRLYPGQGFDSRYQS